MTTKLFFNPDCSKCRDAKDLLEGQACEFEIVEYLKDTPTADELRLLLSVLKLTPLDLIRQGETVFIEQFKGLSFSDDDWFEIMVQHPILIERPILIHNGKAVIGRPPSRILEVF